MNSIEFLEEKIKKYEERIQKCESDAESYNTSILVLMKGELCAKKEIKLFQKEIKKTNAGSEHIEKPTG
ncbi:hypothetical protein MmiHf6_03970 [Methanimicrococcus hongohii]|uniref:Uncharacterized protein n=1 Tax=Methanimicrococcus hongohii TaxID=3028295 RepID=A0AA96UZR6_9EURY|nr:hypothetical protein [Methanimicrococcus sp. Hf6]WNY23098.1 hypothetical protein MmiHf6_03970 [Methanimicrococcus sp. Hf6]